MKGIEIYIDDELLEIDQATSAAITHEIANIEEPDKSLTGNAKDIEVPYTARNRKIMQFSEQILSTVLFNNSYHNAKILQNGSLVMYGSAQVEKYVDQGYNRGHYSLKILGAGADWVRRANNKLLKELESNYSVKYILSEVYANSVLSTPTLIKFFPVDRGIFYIEDTQGDYKDRANVDLVDYHPFINIWLLLNLILEGYTIKSSLESLFRKLYMTGFVPTQDDIEGIEADNDFKIGTNSNPDSLAATFSGSNVEFKLNLFDRWTSPDGDLHMASPGILKYVNGATAFAPTLPCTVSFRMQITYNTSVTSDIQFVDILRFGSGKNKQEIILTPYMSNEYDAEFDSYVPREYAEGEVKKCRYLWFVKPKRVTDCVKIIKREFSYKQGIIVSVGKTRDTILTENIKPEGQWIHVHVGEGMVSVRSCDYYAVDAEGNERLILGGYFEQSDIVPIPDGTLSFTDIEFNTYSFGIGEHQSFPLEFAFGVSSSSITPDDSIELRIGEGCSISPDFRNAFAYGSNVGISVVGGDKKQIQIIQALRHLFNLYFYTNPVTQEVFIEPRPQFYFPVSKDNSNTVDWTDRIDYSHVVENEQLGNNIGDSLRLTYAAGNDVIKNYNRHNKRSLGSFETPLENKTTEGAKELANQLFAPFIRRSVKAMGWTVLQNVPESEKSTISDVEFELTPTIGIFTGISQRTSGADRSTYPSYPVIVFQEGPYNLGFEDSQNGSSVVKGLHQYYDGNIRQYNRARRITAYLRLSAIDIEKIQCPSIANADFRSVFMLKHKGEILYLELEKVADYNPSSGESTKCSFVTKVID